MTRKRSIIWTICTLAILSLFVVRGPRRALTSSSDLRGPYTASVVWLKGMNPYDSKQLTVTHVNQGGQGRLVQLLHPPGILPLLAPLAIFQWQTAKSVWLLVNLVSIGIIILSLLSITPKIAHQWGLLILGTLAFAPIHTAIQLGQLSLSAIAMGLSAFALSGRNYRVIPALLIALAVTLKPQIGLVFLAYLLATLRLKVFLLSLLASSCLLGVGIGGIVTSEIPLADIQTEWQRNLSESNSAKGGDRFTDANPARSNLINLHIFLSAFISDQRVVSITVPIVVLVGCLIWLGLYHVRDRSAPLAIALSLPLILSLQIVYHRTYDAIVLLLPLSWAISEWTGIYQKTARLILITGAVFFVPGGALVAWAQTTDRLPLELTHHPVWKTLVVPHGSIALLVISLILLIVMSRRNSSGQRGIE